MKSTLCTAGTLPLVLVLMAALLAACNESTMIPISTAAPALPLPDISGIGNSGDLESIHIDDYWDGLLPAAPIHAEYVLTRTLTDFSGQAHFTIASGRTLEQSATEAINVPTNVVDEFLKLLSTSTVEDVAYKPRPTITDNYPSISLELSMRTMNLNLHSTAQDPEHIPWLVYLSTAYRSAMINSGIPMRSYELLMPYLKKEVLNQMVKNSPAKSR